MRSLRLRSQAHSLVLLALFSAMLSGCNVIKGIFKAGVGVGVVAVVLVVAVIGGAIAMLRR